MEKNLNEMEIAPVIIEELEEDQVMDMDEFVEASALEIHEVENMVDVPAAAVEMTHAEIDLELSEGEEEVDSVLTLEEEDNLTKQFLNGELTFSEYSSRMDPGIDLDPDGAEPGTSRDEDAGAYGKVTKEPELREEPKKRRNRKKKRNLPLALQGLMGEANLRYARGDTELAIKMCMEIIRQVPSAPEPFHTLAMIYETDDPEKALQFSLIAAHLSPKDAEQWTRLANLSMDSGNIKQAVTCLTKAIQANPKDVKLYEARARLQEHFGEKKALLRGYLKMIHQLGPEDGDDLLIYGKMLTQRFIQDSSYDQALDAMDQIFTKCPKLVTLEEVNIMTELLITMKKFDKCLNILTEYTTLFVKYQDDSRRIIQVCGIPDGVVVDLKAKFLVTLIELGHIDKAEPLFPKLLEEEDPEVSGDLFLDIAEALMAKKDYQRSLKFLEPLVNSKNYSLAAVWLRYAESCAGCRYLKRALLAYEIVAKLSPQHMEAKLQLSTLYKIFGLHERAIDVLQQDPSNDVLDPDVLYRRTVLLLKTNKLDEFLKSGLLLLSRHSVTLRNKGEMVSLTRPRVYQRLENLHLQRLSHGQALTDENGPTFLKNDRPNVEDEFNLFLRMCRVACEMKKFGILQRICFTALTSKRFEPKTPHIIFLALLSCIYNNDSYYGYNLARDLVRDRKKETLWNLLNIVIQRADDSRHNRFIMRLLGREDVFSYIHVLHANNCLVSGTYKYALNDYMSLFKVGPSALLALLIGVTFLQMSSQKFSGKKHRLATQAMAFFKKYRDMRGRDMRQESNYNIARAMHQLGLMTNAVQFYKLVLEEERSELVRARECLDLKREAAFNLHLIYMHSGNTELARIYLEEFIVV
ncbi:general transcription factor 3C polypeptide 3 [Diachasma alloeum]|uniref:general transcription factor 3C polypeptide 3 n=1 Tax=Diachasma alloeum TaxID=454923 RepID=UPI0007384522|nr:general transcription factor 3C polypeptide 3 [Diachasma alloeum]XP_015118076.1 general transcription factor 3C polypeptide 3 [Diachasma alloeum]